MVSSFIDQVIDQLPQDSSYFQQTTIIFPTKRACQYFEKALIKKKKADAIWLPEIISIQAFLYQHAPFVIAQEQKLLSLLHPIHQAKTGIPQSFIEFYPWGQMILKDFSEIDQYLIDSEQLFHYVKALKTIDDMGELTNEQSELLSQFWATIPTQQNADIRENFLKTWQTLSEIYDSFQIALKEQNIAYEGMAYRALLNQLETGEKKFNKKNIILAGFNALSAFEERLFSHFTQFYETTIFWDADYYYLDNEALEAGLFIRRYLKLFPDKANHLIATDFSKTEKHINLANAPLEVVQIDYALSKIGNRNLSETVIVLCDEALLYPLLNKLPADLDCNITMGYPLVIHPIQNLIKLLSEHWQYLQDKKTLSATLILKILQHALLYDYFEPNQLQNLQQTALKQGYLDKKSILNIVGESNLIIEKLLSPKGNVLLCIIDLLEYLVIKKRKQVDDLAIQSTINAIENLALAIEQAGISIEEKSTYKLIKQSLKGIRLPFSSASTDALQIMGFLETRNLDFKNIIILGATDEHLPGTNKASSFIPFSIRKALNLPTYQENDAIYGYHFYRLLQRAENITLVSADAIDSAATAPSRFIEQINYEWSDFENINIKTNDIAISIPKEKEIDVIEIDKNQKSILEKFELYLKGEKQFSASALNVYIRCPFQFYLRYVIGLQEPEEYEEAFDQRVLGQLFHKAMELFYQPFLQSAEWITKPILETYTKSVSLENFLKQAFDLEGINYKKSTALGQNVLIKDIILQFMKLLIEQDMSLSEPFKIVGLEQKIENIPFSLSAKKKVFMKSYIDRVDLVKNEHGEEYYRIIDYKTGNASLNNPLSRGKEKSLEDYFSVYFENDQFKEGFQGYFYAWIFKKQFPDRNITAGFYSAKAFGSGIKMLQNGKILTVDVLEYYEQCLRNLLNEIFDVETPFIQSEDEKAYAYSAFKVLVE